MNSFHARSSKTVQKSPKAGHPSSRQHGSERADTLLVANGLAPSRARARQLIESGLVSVDGKTISKPGQLLPDFTKPDVQEDAATRFVSRGALKLEAALQHTGLDVSGWQCLDIGQSTGGFTDCLLQHGASKVLGVEVGHDQLHPRLASDQRCITLEGINARRLTSSMLDEHFPAGGFDLLVCDASFISLTLLLPQWPALLKPDGHVIALVKPQFEVGPQGLGKGGIVRDTQLYCDVEVKIRSAMDEAGLHTLAWIDSPITGSDGNREFLIHCVLDSGFRTC